MQNKDKKGIMSEGVGGNHSNPTGVSAPGLQGERVDTKVI